MKLISIILVTVFSSVSFGAFEAYSFNCDMGSFKINSKPGVKKAPDNPVVGLNIKVLKEQVPLYLIKADQDGVEKDMFVTDWATPDKLSQDGVELFDLLGIFFGIDTSNLAFLRAGIPTNLLDSFAYLELKDKNGTVTKLGFEGVNPTSCK